VADPTGYTLTREQLDAITRVCEAFMREHPAKHDSAHVDPYKPCALLQDAATVKAWIGHATRGQP
jgi:hypothetical protein